MGKAWDQVVAAVSLGEIRLAGQDCLIRLAEGDGFHRRSQVRLLIERMTRV
jgi:hypothetical protein